MDTITVVLIGITLLFFVILSVKSIFNIKKACAICLSVTFVWLVLLLLYYLNFFADKIIIAILMGHTSIGIYYILEKKVRKDLLIFRLPYLLTSISIIYFILGGFVISTLYLIAGLWILFFIFNLFQNKTFFKNIVECCKKW